MTKMQVHSRSAASEFGIRMGLITPTLSYDAFRDVDLADIVQRQGQAAALLHRVDVDDRPHPADRGGQRLGADLQRQGPGFGATGGALLVNPYDTQEVAQTILRVHTRDVPLAALDLLGSIVAARPPFSVVLTLWVSMMTAVGLASRPSVSRSVMTR